MAKFDSVNNAVICDDVHDFAYQVLQYAMSGNKVACKDSLIPGYFGFIFDSTSVLISENKIADAPGTIATPASRVRLCNFLRYAIEKRVDPTKVTTTQKEKESELWGTGDKIVQAWVKPFDAGVLSNVTEKPEEVEEANKIPRSEKKIALTQEEKLEKLSISTNSMMILD